MGKPHPGDTVSVTYDGKTFSGILMPPGELIDTDITVIKLESGYNLGIKTNRIASLIIIKKYEPLKLSKKKTIFSEHLPMVSVLSFGGTISSKIDYKTGGVYADYSAEDFLEMCPELSKKANIKARKAMSAMSEDMSWKDWSFMAKEIFKELSSPNISGVVVTTGTDTLHFISAALSFFLKDLNKPVIITAAQRSIDRSSSDAFMNLSCAVQTAAKINCAEVMTCLHAGISDDRCILIRGTKVRKMHTSRRDSFRPVNDKPLAYITTAGDLEMVNEHYRERSLAPLVLDNLFEEHVALVLAYPGQDPRVIDFYAEQGYKGIVISATALGHVPTEGKNSLIPSIKRAREKGITVVIATQTIYGSTHPYVYANLRKLSLGIGCIFAQDMLAEVAYIKLGYVLGHAKDSKDIERLMTSNLAGEINTRLLDDDFLL